MLAIIVTYKSEKIIIKFLRSLFRFNKINESEVLIVDNSPDNLTVKRIKGEYKKINIIKNQSNLGFAKSVNQGIKFGKNEDYVVIMNPDIEFSGNLLGKVNHLIKGGKYDILGIQTYNKNMGWHPTAFNFPTFLTGLFEFTNLKKIFPNNKFSKDFAIKHVEDALVRTVDAVSGEFMVISQNVLKKIKGFDEDFFMYMEDIDLCLRASNTGAKIGFVPNNLVIHEGGASSGNKYRIKYRYWSKSRKIYFKKHLNVIQSSILTTIFVIDDWIVSLVKYVKNEHQNY